MPATTTQIGIIESASPTSKLAAKTYTDSAGQAVKLTASYVDDGNGNILFTSGTPGVVSGNLGRTWALSSGADSVAAVQAGAWSVQAVQSGTWSVQSAQSGTWTVAANLQLGGTAVSTSAPVPVQQVVGGAAITAANPAPVQVSVANAAASATNPVPAQLSVGNAAATSANPVPVQLSQGGAALSQSNPAPVAIVPSTLVGVVQSAANTAATLTLPAVAGQYHYITSIMLRRANTSATAVAAAASNLAYTSTNLGGFTVRTGNLAAAGTTYQDFSLSLDNPLKSTAANTATTISAPAAGAGVQTEIIVTYYTAP